MFFDSPKPRISKEEYKKARSLLASRGFNPEELNDVDQLFQSDLGETTDRERGIDKEELARGISWLRKNIGHHRLSENEIKILDEVFSKYI